MRKFKARWWEIPGERFEREIEALTLTGGEGISMRYIRKATDEEVRDYIRYELHGFLFMDRITVH